MGKNAALSENIGHTYNAIGSYDDAELYFQEALRLTQASPAGTKHNEGGILLGLAGAQDRRGDYQKSLSTALQAYRFYKDRDGQQGWDSSLTAKAVMQVSKLHLRLGDLHAAESGAKEAAAIFIKTAGEDSPLVVGAMERLGVVLTTQGRHDEARLAFHRAYEVAAIKDAMDLVEILQLHNQLLDTHLNHVQHEGLDRQAFQRYFPVALQVAGRVRREQTQDGNAGAYYKAAGELLVLGGDCGSGRPLLVEANHLFQQETSVDTSGLIRQCEDLVAFCAGTYTSDSSEASEL